jgi:hypothetical protein
MERGGGWRVEEEGEGEGGGTYFVRASAKMPKDPNLPSLAHFRLAVPRNSVPKKY